MKTQTPSILNMMLFFLLLLFCFQASAYYDPGVQRWINRDPLTEPGFNRVRYNRATSRQRHETWKWLKPEYLFVGNNPETFVDPLGLDITPNGTVELDPATCTKPVFYINSDDPNNRWKWVPMPGGGTVVPVDGIGWWDEGGRRAGLKIHNMSWCVISCDSHGYPEKAECKCPPFGQPRPWKPGADTPDKLPDLPGEGTWD